VLLAKPLTFMNVSGRAVQLLLSFYKIEVADLLIVTDDVNLPLGRLRARPGGTEGGHNGLKSIAQHLGTVDYARLRLGVGRGDLRRDLADHVLARFEPDEQAEVDRATIRAADAVEVWISAGVNEVMNTFNRAED
jgi:PTH1 family peptidyl-tRNA hydrolase